MRSTGTHIPIVEHQPHEQHRGRHRPTAITGEQRRAGAEAPSGALATDEHSSRVEAEHVSVAGEPLQPRVAVLDGHRVGELGCETVLNGGRDSALLEDPLDQHRCDRPSAPADHAATVDEIDPPDPPHPRGHCAAAP